MSAAGTGPPEGEGRRGREQSCASLCITAICSVQPKLLLDIMRQSQRRGRAIRRRRGTKKRNNSIWVNILPAHKYIKHGIKVVK